MHAIALFNLGKTIYYQNNKAQAYKYIAQAIDEMRQSDYKYKYDNLRYNYNSLFVMQQMDHRYEEALTTLNALEDIATQTQDGEPHIDGINEKELKALYANRTVVLHRLYRPEEAETYYKKFLALGQVHDRDNYLIMPYEACTTK